MANSADSLRSHTFVSAQLSHTSDSAYHHNDQAIGLSIFAYQSHAAKWANFKYGVFGNMGQYEQNGIPELSGNKSFYSLGFLVEGGFNIPIGLADWRILGIRFAQQNEWGSYSQFREVGAGDDLLFNSASGRSFPSLFFTSSLAMRAKPNLQLELGVIAGSMRAGLQVNLINSIYIALTGNRLAAHAQIQSQVMAIDVAYTQYQLGFSYRIYSFNPRKKKSG